MNTFSDSEKTIDIPVSKQLPTVTRNIDNQVLVDEDMKQKWDKAKDGKERTAALIAINEMAIHILKQVGNCDTGDLVQLVEQYADLSLAGSCSVQAKSTVRFLEAMENKFIDEDEDKLETVRESLDRMKRMLELLNEIEGDVQEEEEICMGCMVRDGGMAYVDVTSPGIWERESDAGLRELIDREDENERRWYDEHVTETTETGHGLRPPERMSKGNRLTERNLKIWLTVNGIGGEIRRKGSARCVLECII